MSGRRASDKSAVRIQILLVILCTVSSLLAAVIGFKAIRALNQFDEVHEAAFRAGLIIGKVRKMPMPDLDSKEREEKEGY